MGFYRFLSPKQTWRRSRLGSWNRGGLWGERIGEEEGETGWAVNQTNEQINK